MTAVLRRTFAGLPAGGSVVDEVAPSSISRQLGASASRIREAHVDPYELADSDGEIFAVGCPETEVEKSCLRCALTCARHWRGLQDKQASAATWSLADGTSRRAVTGDSEGQAADSSDASPDSEVGTCPYVSLHAK